MVSILPHGPPSARIDAETLLFTVKDCKNSTAGTGADGGALDICQGFSSSVEKDQVASMEFVCYGRGVSSVEGTTTSTEAGYGTLASSSTYTSVVSGSGSGNSDDDEEEHHSRCCHCECCCCCVVM